MACTGRARQRSMMFCPSTPNRLNICSSTSTSMLSAAIVVAVVVRRRGVQRLEARGHGVGRWHHRFGYYADLPSTWKRESCVFRFLHPETRFQKSEFSGTAFSQSVWTVGQNNTIRVCFCKRAFSRGWPLRWFTPTGWRTTSSDKWTSCLYQGLCVTDPREVQVNLGSIETAITIMFTAPHRLSSNVLKRLYKWITEVVTELWYCHCPCHVLWIRIHDFLPATQSKPIYW